MACDPEELRHVPLFELLDDEQAKFLACQVQIQRFAARQRIFKEGEAPQHGYVLMSGSVRVTTTDDDKQEVVVDEPGHGDFFGFASMIQNANHRTSAMAVEESVCLEVGRDDIEQLLKRSPAAGMAMLTMQARQFHSVQKLVQTRAGRNPNEVIEEKTTYGERIADEVARFGGSWTFMIVIGIALVVYSTVNVFMGSKAWDPYPFILLNLFLSMLASVQAPVIMMSQNRQDAKDRVRSELDFDVNRRAEAEIQSISHKLNLVTDKIHDLEEALRKTGTAAPARAGVLQGAKEASA